MKTLLPKLKNLKFFAQNTGRKNKGKKGIFYTVKKLPDFNNRPEKEADINVLLLRMANRVTRRRLRKAMLRIKKLPGG
ncbi:MAG: hypothetical protein KDB92_14655, partial [Chitinophagaceae bacterium]|nr:hypothetical protein [Chitinophagaceae bacterium]